MTTLVTEQETPSQTTPAGAPAGRSRLRDACHQIQLAIQEMNYASRRLAELQAPWGADTRGDSR
jgi:hypothetical protein